MGQWDGKVALVTGASSGIGRLTAAHLAEHGARVVVADIAVEAGREAAEEVGGAFVALDVSDSTAWTRALDEALGPDGRVDIAHLTAGIATEHGDIATLTDDRYRRVMGVNVDGVVFGTRAVLDRMGPGGAIIATASLGGLIPMAGDPIYSMGKHAVVADTVVRILEEGRTGEAWFCQPGRDPAPYEFRGVPGPRLNPEGAAT